MLNHQKCHQNDCDEILVENDIKSNPAILSNFFPIDAMIYTRYHYFAYLHDCCRVSFV